MLKRTPLYHNHAALNARFVAFGGWEMPVQYSGIIEEHQAVRSSAGLFDISHMGEVIVAGAAAEEFLNGALTNDLRKLAVGQGQYTLMCNERGGVIDDLYAYRFSTSEFLIIVNAGRVETDFAWLQRLLGKFDRRHLVSLTNVSDNTAAIAVQGPAVVQFIDECFSGGSTGGAVVARASDLKKNQIAQFLFNHNPAWVSRTGYTGEDGFEIVSTPETIVAAWDKLMAVGGPHGLRPAGLGARDTLRTEVCYPLYGQDLDEQSSPMEAGLSAFVAFNKGEFVGRTVLLEQKEHGIVRKCVAFKMTDKSAPPRPHYTIWAAPNGAFIGEVSSGTQSPTLGIGIGMGYLKAEFAKPQTHLEIEIRGRRHPAIVTPRPLYRKPV